MRRFLITSPSFTGQAEIVFRENGTLSRIDCMDTNMDRVMMNHFKCRCPEHFDLLEEAFKGTKAHVVEAEFEINVDDFIREYPYKRNTHLVRTYWPKMNKAEQIQAYEAAKEYRKYCDRNGWYKPKIAEGWLKQKEYLNDWKKM